MVIVKCVYWQSRQADKQARRPAAVICAKEFISLISETEPSSIFQNWIKTYQKQKSPGENL